MYRLGLDLGTNSIGWALFRLNGEGEPDRLTDGGVLIFPDGRNPKDKSSNASKRREKRGPRRNRDRMLRRRRALDHVLTDLGLMPSDSAMRDAAFALDPWMLRRDALDRPLAPHELARALWSFIDRRGFKSNRKTDKADEKGKMALDTSELERRIEEVGARTYGDYMARRLKRGRTIKARLGNGLYPTRELIEDEFAQIQAAQAAHQDLSDEDWAILRETIFFQRPLVAPDIGICLLEPSETRGYKAWPIFQRFRILSDLARMQLAYPNEASRALTYEEYQKLFLAALNQKQLSFDKVRSLLSLPEGTLINLETKARKGIDGDLSAAVMAATKRWGKVWRTLSLQKQQSIIETLIDNEDEAAVVKFLRETYGLTKDTALAVSQAPLPVGTASFGKTALTRLVDIMADSGLLLSDAIQEAGYAHHSDFRHEGTADRLPYYGQALRRHVIGGNPDKSQEVEKYGRLPNPTVHIALSQVRKLFNELVDTYGLKPDEVIVEVARKLKRSKKQRDEAEKTNRTNQARNERLKAEIEAAGAAFSPSLLRKMQIWDEQGPYGKRFCPFTGTPLSINMVLSNETEIEHILPFSRTWDDSRNNKVISLTSANRFKANRSPAEAWAHDPDTYRAIQDRATAYIPRKAWRFAPDAMERFQGQGGFLARQLNETRHLSKLVKEYLTVCVPDNKVHVIPGQLTAMLRGKWGLNSILGDENLKNRTDHRHHLIDAVVIGLTSRSMLQQISRAADHPGLRERLIEQMPDPWPGFRMDVLNLVRGTIVHHKPDHALPKAGVTTGSLHNDTAYGIVDGPDEKGYYTLVCRKDYAALKEDDIKNIRDLALQNALRDAWDAYQTRDDDKATWATFLTHFAKSRTHGKNRIGLRHVRILNKSKEDSLAFIRDKTGRPYKAYKTDGNAYMDIWQLPNGKCVGETVTRFDAHSPDYSSPVHQAHPTARKLMRLFRNDMVAVGEGEDRRLMRVQKFSGQTIVCIDHNEGGDLREREKTKDLETRYIPYRKSAGQVLKAGLRKVSVSPTGQIRDRGPIRG